MLSWCKHGHRINPGKTSNAGARQCQCLHHIISLHLPKYNPKFTIFSSNPPYLPKYRVFGKPEKPYAAWVFRHSRNFPKTRFLNSTMSRGNFIYSPRGKILYSPTRMADYQYSNITWSQIWEWRWSKTSPEIETWWRQDAPTLVQTRAPNQPRDSRDVGAGLCQNLHQNPVLHKGFHRFYAM